MADITFAPFKMLVLQLSQIWSLYDVLLRLKSGHYMMFYYVSNPLAIIWCFIVLCFRESAGTLNLIHPSVCLSVHVSVTKTLTLAITFALWQVELWYLACVFVVTRTFRWYHVVTLIVTFDLLQGQICCRAGDHNSLNLLVMSPIWPLYDVLLCLKSDGDIKSHLSVRLSVCPSVCPKNFNLDWQ